MKWLVFSVTLLFSSAIWAQAQPVDTNFSKKDKEAFVKVFGKINEIQVKYQSKITPDGAKNEVESITQKAQAEMAEAIDKQEGIDINLYNRIVFALEKDSSLREELQKELLVN